jgi:hypothetical protein
LLSVNASRRGFRIQLEENATERVAMVASAAGRKRVRRRAVGEEEIGWRNAVLRVTTGANDWSV